MIPIVISSTGVIPKSLSQSLTRLNLHPNTYIQLQKICNSWHMFNCKKLLKLQIRPLSLILLIATSQDRWIFPSQKMRSEKFGNNDDIIIIIIEFFTSQLWLGNIHLSWDIVINRIRLGGLICSFKSFLQLNMCPELLIFAVVYMYWGAS